MMDTTWVRFSKEKEINGVLYHPGDWAEIDRNLARQWIISGQATVARLDKAMPIGDDCGVVVAGDVSKATHIREVYPKLSIAQAEDKWQLPHEKTLIWNPVFNLRPELLFVGFDLLDRWLIAAPTDDTAGNPATLAYDTDLVFIRRHKDTVKFLKALKEKAGAGRDERAAFGEAIRECGIIALALPDVWTS